MFYLIAEMFSEEIIDSDTKAKLKYMVCLNDANLFNVLRKHENIDDMKEEVRRIGESINLEALQEQVASTDILQPSVEDSAVTGEDDLGGQKSP